MWEVRAGFVQGLRWQVYDGAENLIRVQLSSTVRMRSGADSSEAMTTNAARQNTDHLRRLEEMRATYDRLRTERIRAESEVERLAGELERAKENARTTFGTDDEAEIGRASCRERV